MVEKSDTRDTIEKLKEDWHLAGYRIEQIGEFVDKVRRFQYRSRLKLEEKPLRKYENALYSLFFDMNLYIQVRDHEWAMYGWNDIETEEDIKNAFKEANESIRNKRFEKAFNTLENLDRIINYARIKEGFDIPNQITEYDPNNVSTEQRAK